MFAWSHAAPLSNHCALGNNPEPLNGCEVVEKDVFFSEHSEGPNALASLAFHQLAPARHSTDLE
ncbi:hypothetical protein, partial [Bradyrhizobium guangdongense]|uniref:hypothetical protein n=1 Tax=Bradyrhizobium guangdongense TaxID=1325090 RepID=UPI001AECBCDD